jgi:prepilin-type N-terminal cleavage/methylation domain-containing protein
MAMAARNDRVGRRRPGFTLVEMLVVIGLILVLATLTVAFAPRFLEREKVTKGIDQLQGWFLIAKQRAKSDRTPTGIRLQRDPKNASLVRDLQYIQQPDHFSGGVLTGMNVTAVPPTVTISGVDLHGGLGPGNPALWPVQPGDYLEIKGGGLMHRIIGVVNLGGAVGNTLQLFSAPAPLANATNQYRIIRGPRVLQGESPLQLPQDIAIDLGKCQGLPVDANAPHRDILFAPSGSVVEPAAASDKIILWVRDASRDAGDPGEQLLITVYVRTGLIAAHPVDTGSNDPYSFTRDGKSSGL